MLLKLSPNCWDTLYSLSVEDAHSHKFWTVDHADVENQK